MPHSNTEANPQPPKKGFFASLFARHTTRESSAQHTAPQPALPTPEPQPPIRHPLQDQIDVLFARLSETLSDARFHNAGVKRRDVLDHQYRRALRAYRGAGSEKDRQVTTKVLEEILKRLLVLDEETMTISAIARGEKPAATDPSDGLGLVTKALGQEYAGESSQRGWREGLQGPPAGTIRHQIWKMMVACTFDRITEGGWSEAKRAQRELKIAADGAVSTDDGRPYDSYVVDPQTGKTYLFKENEIARRPLGAEEIETLEVTLAQVEALERELHSSLVSKTLTKEEAATASTLSNLVDSLRTCKDESEREPIRAQIKGIEPELERIRKSIGIDLYQTKLDLIYMKNSKERLRNAISSRVVALGTHHSSPLDGKPVAGGGTLAIENARITQISNVSGHYKPLFVHLAQTIEHLMRQGALLDKTITYIDQDGKTERLDANPELKALYDTVNSKLPELERLKKEAAAVVKELDASPQDLSDDQLKAKQIALEQQLAELRRQMEPIADALHMLQKLGTGPANRTSDARVVFLDNIQSKTGLQIHMERDNATVKPTVGEFLASGGAHKIFAKPAPNAEPKSNGDRAEPSNGAPPKGAYTEKTVRQAKSEVLAEIRTRVTKEGIEVSKNLDDKAERLREALEEAMGEDAFARFKAANQTPTSEDLKRALASLQPQQADQPSRVPASTQAQRNPPASSFGQNYQWSDTNSAPTGKLDSPYDWDERRSDDRESAATKPNHSAASAYSPLKLEETGAVTADSGAGYANARLGDEAASSNSAAAKREARGFPIPRDFVHQVEQRFKGKVTRVSGMGLNCFIRSILTGVSNAGWRPRPPQTLENVITEIAQTLRAEGLRAPDGLIDAGGSDGARVRELIKAKTGADLGIRIITWDTTNARITAFDMTVGSLKITLVNSPGHFDLLS